jgi:hypothetical protein
MCERRGAHVPSNVYAAVARDVQLTALHHLRNEARHGQITQCEEGTTFELEGKQRSKRRHTRVAITRGE